MRLEACLPDSWWEFAFATATHVYNHTPIKCLKWKTPQEILTGEKPKISHLCVFGCGAYVYLPNEVCTNKLTPCSELIIFIGYEDNSYRFIRHTQGNVIFRSTQAIFDERHFPRYPSSHPREQTPPGRLNPKVESSAPGPFGVDEPTPTPFPPIPIYPRLSTPPIPPNLPTHSESPSPSPPLTPSKQSSVKIEEVEDDEDEDVEMHPSSPPLPEAGPSQYTSSQVPTVIPQKQGSDPQPGEDIPPLRYGLRRSTYETRVPHREGNVYEEDRHPTDVLRHSEWRQHPGEADLDMAHRMLENACRYFQAQPKTIPIGGVYYPYSQWNNTTEINGIRYEVD